MNPIPRHRWNPKPPHNPHVSCDWNGKVVRLHHTAMVFKYKTKRRKNRIAEEAAHMRLLQEVAFGRGFSDISYPYVAFPSGRIWVGRGEEILGAHTLNHNTDCAISLAGNFEIQKVTARMRLSVSRFVAGYLHRKFGTKRKLVPHKATYPTSCPGKNACKAFRV